MNSILFIMTTAIRTEFFPSMIDGDVASFAFEHLRSSIAWEEGIRSRLGFTRLAKSLSMDDDDETDLQNNTFIASISLGSVRDFDIKDKTTGKLILRIPLAHGSLFLMGRIFKKTLKHGIPKRLKIKDPRINLTFRKIKEVIKD